MIKTHTEREALDPTNSAVSRAPSGVSEEATAIPAVDSPAIRRSDNGSEVVDPSPIAPPARPSRRGFLMNTMVSAASLTAAT
jgi:hypothetical protein